MPVESFFGDASLAFFASTESAKEGTAYSMKPTDGSGDFTFTRGSNLSATYIGRDGYIKKGYENFLRQSNSFDTSPWQFSNGADVTPNHSGYDGTNDAWYLYKNTGTTSQLIKQDVSLTGVQTFSFYAKAEELEWIRFLWYGTTGGRNHFHLVGDGDFGTGQNIVSRNIEAVGNGWYKCSTTINDSVTQIQIFPASGENSVTGSTGGVYIQDAMLNQGLVAYPYLETTTAKAINALTDNEPRYDWSSGSAALLLEPGRTNLVTYSEALYQLPVKGGVSWQDNVTTSPEGLQNAGKMTEGTGAQYLAQSSLPNGNRVMSVFAKYDNSLTRIVLGQYITTNQVANAVFNIQTGTILSETTGSSNVMILEDADVEDYGNGWRRYWVSISGSSGVAYVGPSNSDTISYVPSYTGSGQHCFLYGLQYEQNATYPTSYIPTYGTIEERVQDILGGINSNTLFNPSQGVWYLNLYYSVPSNEQHITLHNTPSNHIRIRLYPNGQYLITSNNYSVDVGTGAGGLNIQNSFYKVAIKYDNGNISAFFNGQKIDAYTGTYTPFTSLTSMNFYTYYNTPSSVYTGAVKQTMYFPTALSDDDCITLTTP